MLGVLEEASQRFDYPVFDMVKKQIKRAVLAHPKDAASNIRKGLSPQQAIYSMIANIAGDHAESGNYHLYRGVLNPLTGGEDLLRIFNTAVDEMVVIGAVEPEEAEDAKEGIRENIRTAG